MNLAQLLMLLQRLRGQQRPNVASNARRDISSAGRQTMMQSPYENRLMGQLNQDYLNPGGGRLGNDIVGGGQVFGGFYRGGPQGSYYGMNPNVGNSALMQGGSPNMGQTGDAGFQRLGMGGPQWSASNWMQDLLNMNQQNAMPYTGPYDNRSLMGNGLSALLSNNQGGQYHGGGQGMLEFLNRGNDQSSMDLGFRGLGGGTGMDFGNLNMSI